MLSIPAWVNPLANRPKGPATSNIFAPTAIQTLAAPFNMSLKSSPKPSE